MSTLSQIFITDSLDTSFIAAITHDEEDKWTMVEKSDIEEPDNYIEQVYKNMYGYYNSILNIPQNIRITIYYNLLRQKNLLK